MPDYDQSLKRIISKAPDGFLKLIAPDLQWREELSPELPSVSRQADLIWRVARMTTGEEFTLHIELQVKPEDDVGERLAEYAIRLWRRDHVPVRSAVVFLKPARSLPSTPFEIACDGTVRLSYTFDTVALWTLSPAIVLDTPYYDLWPLAGIMGDVTTESVLDVAQRINTAKAPKSERRDLENVLMLLTGLRMSRAAARKIGEMIPMLKDIWEESTWKDALADMAAASYMRKIIVPILESRFGMLDDSLKNAIEQADNEQLEALAPYLATATLEQIREQLDMPPKSE